VGSETRSTPGSKSGPWSPDPRAQFVNATRRGHEAWRDMHDEWVRRSSNGIHIQTSRGGHHVQDDEPQLVVEAIRFVSARFMTRQTPDSSSRR
jgi:hypothetical protein